MKMGTLKEKLKKTLHWLNHFAYIKHLQLETSYCADRYDRSLPGPNKCDIRDGGRVHFRNTYCVPQRRTVNYKSNIYIMFL